MIGLRPILSESQPNRMKQGRADRERDRDHDLRKSSCRAGSHGARGPLAGGSSAAGLKFPRLMGQTLGFIAFGHVPRAVARRARPFGLRMLAYDPFVEELIMPEYDALPASCRKCCNSRISFRCTRRRRWRRRTC